MPKANTVDRVNNLFTPASLTPVRHVFCSSSANYSELSLIKCDATLETHKEIPCFFCYPVDIRSGIFHVIGMTTHE